MLGRKIPPLHGPLLLGACDVSIFATPLIKTPLQTPSWLERGKHLLGREIAPPQIPPLSAPVALRPRTFGACQGSSASIFALPRPLQKILVWPILGG